MARHWRLLIALLFALAWQPAQSDDPPPPKPRDDIFPKRLDRIPAGADRKKAMIEGGKPELAQEYYDALSKQWSAPPLDSKFTLHHLIDYLGFKTIRPEQLEDLEPALLMDAARLKAKLPEAVELADPASWDVLSARYFAPKTSDVSGLSNKLSWRKVVRLKPRPGSPAEKDGVAALFFLSVVYVDDLSRDPFEPPATHTANIQTILVRNDARRGRFELPAYFIVFEPRQRGYALSYFTATSWDAADPDLAAQSGVKRYHVPDACIECHGYDPKTTSLQTFDTDYILDRTRPGDDFARVGQSPWAPLFDCGKDPQTEQHKKAFDVFRRLNQEIGAQNQQADANSRVAAVSANWLRLHANSSDHVPPMRRAIDKPGTRAWSEDDEIDRTLLPLLNRYCYRCHGTVYYNVFSKEDVLRKRKEMLRRLMEIDPHERMPLDRNLYRLQPDGVNHLLHWLHELDKAN